MKSLSTPSGPAWELHVKFGMTMGMLMYRQLAIVKRLQTCSTSRFRIAQRLQFGRGPIPAPMSQIIGIGWAEYRLWLEDRFKPGMGWERINRPRWHIDHVVPLARARSLDELVELAHYTNTYPLWAIENMRKGDA